MKYSRLPSHRAAGMAALALLLAPASPARAQDGETTARTALAALAAEERKQPSGRLALTVTERRGPFVAGEKLEDTRKRILATDRTLVVQGRLLYGPEGLFKDLGAPAGGNEPAGTRTRTSELAGIRRTLFEARVDGEDRKWALVTRATGSAPGDAILTRQVAKAADGIRWATARAEGERLTLDGARADERHSLVLRTGALPQVESWSLTRKIRGPQGDVEQTYRCEVAAGETAGSIKRIEEWVLNPPPYATVSYRATEVKSAEAAPVTASDLALSLPKGARVTDSRTDVTVEYEQTEAGVKDEDIARFVQQQTTGRAQAGDTAPPFDLRALRGKRVKLGDYRGKPLLLFWFASWSKAAEAAGAGLEQLYQEARRQGLQVLAINVAEEDQPELRAEAFRKRFNWSFPVALDLEGETQRRYGADAAVPKIAIVDRTGKLVYVKAGADWAAAAAALTPLLGGKK